MKKVFLGLFCALFLSACGKYAFIFGYGLIALPQLILISPILVPMMIIDSLSNARPRLTPEKLKLKTEIERKEFIGTLEKLEQFCESSVQVLKPQYASQITHEVKNQLLYFDKRQKLYEQIVEGIDKENSQENQDYKLNFNKTYEQNIDLFKQIFKDKEYRIWIKDLPEDENKKQKFYALMKTLASYPVLESTKHLNEKGFFGATDIQYESFYVPGELFLEQESKALEPLSEQDRKEYNKFKKSIKIAKDKNIEVKSVISYFMVKDGFEPIFAAVNYQLKDSPWIDCNNAEYALRNLEAENLE